MQMSERYLVLDDRKQVHFHSINQKSRSKFLKQIVSIQKSSFPQMCEITKIQGEK